MTANCIRSSVTAIGIIVARLRIVLFMSAFMSVLAALAHADGISVVEDFQKNDFGRDKWKIDKVDAKDGKVEISENSLHFTALPGPKRPEFRVSSKFGLDGDFEVSMDFSVNQFPTPESEFVNTEIILGNRDGIAYFSRLNHQGAGQGYLVYFSPTKESGRNSLWKHEAGTDVNGKLRIRRIGDQMTFSFLSEGQSIFTDIATVDFGTDHIDRVTYGVNIAGKVDSPVDVRIDNLEVKSIDRRTVRGGEAPRSIFGRSFWIGLVIVVLLAAVLGYVLWRPKGSDDRTTD